MLAGSADLRPDELAPDEPAGPAGGTRARPAPVPDDDEDEDEDSNEDRQTWLRGDSYRRAR